MLQRLGCWRKCQRFCGLTAPEKAESVKEKISSLVSVFREYKSKHQSETHELGKAKRELDEWKKKCTWTEAQLVSLKESKGEDIVKVHDYEMMCERAKRGQAESQEAVLKLQSALATAQQEHSSLRSQLEQLNQRVADLCKEAEEKGRKMAAKQIRAEIKSLEETERAELLAQFKKFYEENISLQKKLEESQAALALARRDVHSTQSEQVARLHYEQAIAKIKTLEDVNQKLSAQLDSLRNDLDEAKRNRARVVEELNTVKDKLFKVREDSIDKSGVGVNSDALALVTEKNAELRLLHDQFKKLSAQSALIEQKFENTETSINNLRTAQTKNKTESKEKAKLVQKLNDTILKAVDESKKRDQEVGELATMMESRLVTAEFQVDKIEKDISTTKGKFQATEMGLSVLKQKVTGASSSFSFESSSVYTGGMDGDTIQSDGDKISSPDVSTLTGSESRDDGQQYPQEGKPSSPTKRSTRDEPSLTTRALEAIAKGKRRSNQRKFGLSVRTKPFMKGSITKKTTVDEKVEDGSDHVESEREFAEPRISTVDNRE